MAHIHYLGKGLTMVEFFDWVRVILMVGSAAIGVTIVLLALFGGETDHGGKE